MLTFSQSWSTGNNRAKACFTNSLCCLLQIGHKVFCYN